MSTSPPGRGNVPPSKSPETEPDPTARPPEWGDANCRAVLEAAPDAMLVVNRAGEVVAANLQAQKLYGYSREHLIGRVVESLIPARLRDRHRQHRENFFANPETKFMEVLEILAQRSDASEFPVDVSLSRLTIGSETFAISVSRDATERRRIDELKRAEAALRETRKSEKRYRRIVETTNEGVWLLNSELHTCYVNRQMEEMLGYEPGEMLGHSVFDFYFPEDFEHKQQVLKRREQGLREQIEERLRRKDGLELWVRIAANPIFKDTGEFDGALAMVSDITERKLAEEALASVSRKLIEAQEQERGRIGRELHDDIGQRLAMVAIELQQLHENRLVLRKVRRRMGKLQKQISEIAADTQSLSHELHSVKLQYLGIAAAVRGFCREFGKQHKVEIDFKSHDLPSPVPSDISLCFFRVLQEALHNSAKHSGIRHFEVRLWGTSDEIHLTVKDSGVGFDREAAKTSQGLGLISMEERVKLVKGTLSIESQLKRGTTIHARVPLSSSEDSVRAAG